MSALPYLGAADVVAALSPGEAVDAIRAALADFDPAGDAERIAVPLRSGEFLLMPSDAGASAGVKVLTVAPANPDAGLPRIQGLYLLADAETLTPRALLDGAALTTLRTPAVSFAAVHDRLLVDSDPLDVVVFGAGPQAEAHLTTLREVLAGRRAIASVTRIVRNPARVSGALAAGGTEASAALARAGLVVCATTARTPLFDSALLRRDAVVIAVGSHEADARELDAALMARAAVVVEDPATALREAGDVVLAVAEGALDPAALIPMRAVVRGETPAPADRPTVFKSTGMSWEDLVIAEAVVRRGRPSITEQEPR